MNDLLVTLGLLYPIIKDSLATALAQPQKLKTKKIKREIVNLQRQLETIIDSAADIFTEIERIKTSDTADGVETLDKLLKAQYINIRRLSDSLGGRATDEVLMIFSPETRRDLMDLVHKKGGRLSRVSWRVRERSIHEIKTLYSDEYLQQGKTLINEIKRCSIEISELIKAKISIEDVI